MVFRKWRIGQRAKRTLYHKWREKGFLLPPIFSFSRYPTLSFYTLPSQIRFFPPTLSLQLTSPLSSSLSSAMPTIAKLSFAGDTAKDFSIATPQKRRLRSNSTAEDEAPTTPPAKWKSPRRCIHSSPKSVSNVSELVSSSSSSSLSCFRWIGWVEI